MMTILFAVAALTVLVSSLCSLFEATLYSTRMGALEAARDDGKFRKQAERLIHMKGNIARPTSAILILNTIANTAGATICGMYAAQLLGADWVLAFSALLTLAILFVGEILPKTFGALHWRSLWRFIVLPLSLMETALSPLITVTQRFADFFTGRQGPATVTEEEIRASIRLGRKSGQLSSSELQLLNAVFHFDDTLARQIMAPRREVVHFDVGWPLAKCLEVQAKTRHTRYPLCHGSLDTAVGLIHIKDLLGIDPQAPFDLTAIARPLRHVPETLPISRLMRQMQSSRQHMAIVDDEYGTAVGVITMENVMEQIVGAVQDEFDTEPPEIVPAGPGEYLVLGRLPVDRINRELGLDLYSHGVDSISGLVVSKVNRMLKVGDQAQLDGALAEVVEEQGGRATQIRITLADAPLESEDASESEPVS